MNRFKATLVQSHIPQKHATQLDGTKDRGLFLAGRPHWHLGIWAKSDIAVDWTVEVELPNPKEGDPNIVFPWLKVTGTSIIDCLNMALPVGTKVTVKTTAGTNPVVQFVTELAEQRGQ
jgi:hypothetical protein